MFVSALVGEGHRDSRDASHDHPSLALTFKQTTNRQIRRRSHTEDDPRGGDWSEGVRNGGKRGYENGGIFEERNDKKRLESVRVESGTAIGFQSENPIIGGILRLANERCLEEESKSQENSLQSQRNSEEIREKTHGRNWEENEQKKHQKEGSQITSNEEEK